MSAKMIGIILGAGLATYFTRFPMMLLSNNKEISPKLSQFMSFIAPAVLTALIVPAIFLKEGKFAVSLNNPYIIASGITVLVAYVTKKMLITVLTGICTVAMLMYMG